MLETFSKKLMQPQNGLLDRKIFNDSEIYRMEQEQIFARCWLFLGHESMIANPYDFITGYMGEEPVLITRDGKGKLHTFLNMCTHRGNMICRAEKGNNQSFMCTYHGWTFSIDGKLVGVPGFKEVYFEELDKAKWGLVEVAQMDSYKGLMFATFDSRAPSLIDYLGDQKYELDLSVDRREGGAEVIGGVQRWVMKANWKFAVDNFGGDDGHHMITHGSVRPVVIDGKRWFNAYAEQKDPNNRMNMGGGWITEVDSSGKPLNEMGYMLGKYEQEHQKELRERMGGNPALNTMRGTFVGSIFPNMSFSSLRFNFRIWLPKGPDKTEVWHYCIVDKKAPPEIKSMIRLHLTETFGPSGNLEQDDMNNWQNSTFTAKGIVAQRQPMTILAGLGHDKEVPVTGTKLRAIYIRWAEMMNAASWDNVSINKSR